MNKVLLFFSLVFISINTFSQTNVSGNQSGTWTKSNSPYIVTDDITVPSGQTLDIEAGVTIDFQGHYKLTVLGILNAIGTEDDLIYFTTTTSFSTGWNGVSIGKSITGSEISADGISHFTFCKFQYGMTATDNESLNINGGAVRLIGSNAEFNDCIFAGNSTYIGEGMGGAVYCRNTGNATEALTKFINCKFLNNIGYSEGGAVKLTGDQNTEFINCEFKNNRTNYGGGAIMFYTVTGTKMINSLFVDNKTIYDNGGAFKTLGAGNTIFFKNCTIVRNTADGGSGGALALYYGSADFVNCIIHNNTSQYDDDNVYIDAGTGTGTVNYCNTVMPEYNTTGDNNIETDPLFVDAENDDFHLQVSSPCIDAGTDIGLSYFGTAPDMGCFESNYDLVKYINSKELILYPNPSINKIHFKDIEKVLNNKLDIVDVSGKIVKSIILKENNIDISDLTKGFYFIKIKVEGKVYINSFEKI